MDGLKGVIFSRDRAMQLDAFLCSVEQHVPDLMDEIVVLYRASDERFAAGYDRLRAERAEVTWVAETSFRDDVLGALGGERSLVFHTDDDVYFRPAGAFEFRREEVCFTLRLGLNTTYCYPLDADEELRDPEVVADRVSWDWQAQGPGAYSYPLALNGHVFRAGEAHDWLRRCAYSNPNELEASLQALLPEARPRMASFVHSVVVSIPANIVNETYANRHGALHDVRDLNARFLAGERIDLREMDFGGVNACHAEIPYAFARTRETKPARLRLRRPSR